MLALIALLIVAAIILFLTSREPGGAILSMRAAPGARVVLLRRGFEERDTVHAALYDASGRHLWSEALFGVQPGGRALVADERVVVPARDRNERPATHVFQLADGAFAFRADPPPATVPTTAHARYAVASGRLFELYPGEPGSLSVYELASGRRVYAEAAPEGAEGLAVVGSVVVLTGSSSALEAATLTPTRALPSVAREPKSPGSLSLADGCLRWSSASGEHSTSVSELGGERAILLEGDEASVLRVSLADDEVALAAVDREGALHLARIRSEEGAFAESSPAHVGPDAVFVRTERRVLGLRLPELTAPGGELEGFEVRAERRAAAGCDLETRR